MSSDQLTGNLLFKATIAKTDHEISDCLQVMKVLRPHLQESSFVHQIRRQQAQGYTLAFIKDEDRVVTAAGYRIAEFLAWGKVFYVDDLVTDPAKEGRGFGGAMVDWLITAARKENCTEFHLDSGYQRHAAHRLYLNKGLKLVSHHFSLKIESGSIPMGLSSP